MVHVSSFELGPYRVSLYQSGSSGKAFRVKCTNYRSPVYAGSWRCTDFHNVTYILLEGDFQSCIYQFFNEIHYLESLYKDLFDDKGRVVYGLQFSLRD